jgi:CCR4-NOT transcription complex subunit 1
VCQLTNEHGLDLYLHFYRRLIIQARPVSASAPAAFDPSVQLATRLLAQETQRLARDPFLADHFRDAVDRGEGEVFRNFALGRFLDRLGLRSLERLVLAAAILAAPTRNQDLPDQARGVLRAEFDNAVLALCQTPAFDGGADLGLDHVAKLMTNLLADLPGDVAVLDVTQRQALIMAAQTKFSTQAIAPILQRILPSISYVPLNPGRAHTLC